jgi:hypothetical protein
LITESYSGRFKERIDEMHGFLTIMDNFDLKINPNWTNDPQTEKESHERFVKGIVKSIRSTQKSEVANFFKDLLKEQGPETVKLAHQMESQMNQDEGKIEEMNENGDEEQIEMNEEMEENEIQMEEEEENEITEIIEDEEGVKINVKSVYVKEAIETAKLLEKCSSADRNEVINHYYNIAEECALMEDAMLNDNITESQMDKSMKMSLKTMIMKQLTLLETQKKKLVKGTIDLDMNLINNKTRELFEMVRNETTQTDIYNTIVECLQIYTKVEDDGCEDQQCL